MNAEKVFSRSQGLTIAKDAAVSEAFNFAGCSAGVVLTPDTWTAGNIGFKVCATADGTFIILRDETATPVQIAGIATAAAGAYALPAKLAGAMWVKLWSKHVTAGTESDVTQAAARAMVVMMKG